MELILQGRSRGNEAGLSVDMDNANLFALITCQKISQIPVEEEMRLMVPEPGDLLRAVVHIYFSNLMTLRITPIDPYLSSILWHSPSDIEKERHCSCKGFNKV
ncbi:hypothetical protein Tco_0707287 [Tanacetum coccineum]|uniref:Uncharacterized protein n=1 Tax=Tanacetum coccineum TaxID=301880 RepID=A0ABQ4YBE0_9ASTR